MQRFPCYLRRSFHSPHQKQLASRDEPPNTITTIYKYADPQINLHERCVHNKESDIKTNVIQYKDTLANRSHTHANEIRIFKHLQTPE